MRGFKKKTAIFAITAMIFTLFSPINFAYADISPTLTLKTVDASGNDVANVASGQAYFLRVDVSGIEQIYSGGIKVKADGAVFGGVSSLVKKYSECSDFKDAEGRDILEINTLHGVEASASVMNIKFTKNMETTGKPPVITGGFTLVDIPFTATVSASTGEIFSLFTGPMETYIAVKSGIGGKHLIGHKERHLAVNVTSANEVDNTNPVIPPSEDVPSVEDVPPVIVPEDKPEVQPDVTPSKPEEESKEDSESITVKRSDLPDPKADVALVVLYKDGGARIQLMPADADKYTFSVKGAIRAFVWEWGTQSPLYEVIK